MHNKAIALGAGFMIFGATVAHAQLGGFLKALKEAAKEMKTQDGAAPAPSSSPTASTSLSGRWVPLAESCAGAKGVSERMIELKGKEMNGAFASCEFPAAISSRTAYNGSMSCSDEEGGETNKAVAIAIQQNGTMLWREREGGGPISQAVYKKCSPAPRFPYEDPPAPVKPAAVRGTSAKAPAKPKVACAAGEVSLAVGTFRKTDSMENMAGVAFCQGPAKAYYSIRNFYLDGAVSEFRTPRDGKINYEEQQFQIQGERYPGSLYVLTFRKTDLLDALIIPAYSLTYGDVRDNTIIYAGWEGPSNSDPDFAYSFNLGKEGISDVAFLNNWSIFQDDISGNKITTHFSKAKTRNNYRAVMENQGLPVE